MAGWKSSAVDVRQEDYSKIAAEHDRPVRTLELTHGAYLRIPPFVKMTDQSEPVLPTMLWP
jgi:hypothetical protein